ncbi:MAG: glycoside hydrolase family 3 N-terminal domain-containing protein [Planctomycetota bacterium]
MTPAPTDYLVAPTLRLDKGEGLAEGLRCLREFDPRVFMIFGGDAEDVQWLHETMEDQANHPILFCADLERGAGQQFEGLTPLPDAWALGLLGPEASYNAGHRTAAEAATANVRWILGPVLDLHRLDLDATRSPIIANRAFGGEIQRVIECAGAFLQGMRDAGGIACAKHFPGHGGVAQDSHTEMAVCFEDPTPHLEPFKTLLDLCPSIMVGHIEFPLIDPEGRPASRSKVMMDILREDWKYDGVVVTDSLQMVGFGDGPHEELAVESIHAGVDLLLDPEDPVTLAITLRDALKRGDLDEERVFQAVGRLDQLIRLGLDTEVAPPRPLVLGGGAKTLLRPLPGGAAGRTHARPVCALNLASVPDALKYLAEWDMPVFKPDDEPPASFPGPLLVLCGAREGHGLPNIPGPWLEAIQHHHPALYMAGAPDAAQLAPAAARGWYLPGLSPALLGMLITAGE